jgi:VIT1/CCC1 family predicted Fe2+/Mn2+ transporter
MDASVATGHDHAEQREPVLDTVDRVSELCFGLFMALTFVGAISVVSAGPDSGRKLMYSALGCNLAWGLADAVMFLVRTLTNRGKRLSLALNIKQQSDSALAVQTLHDALPTSMRGLVATPELELIRARLVAMETLPRRARLGAADFAGAFGIFVIVVLSTFPVALPFVLFHDIQVALIVSRVLTLLMLFAGGYALGRFAGMSGWRAGFSMVALGSALTMAIVALGG